MEAHSIAGIDWGIVFGTGLTVYMALCSVFYFQVLKHEESRKDFIQKIENKIWIEFYRKLVSWLLGCLQVWFGNKRSIKAFSLCLAFAFIYPFTFFLLAYSWGNGSHEFSGIPFFDPKSAYRNLFFPVFIAYLAFLSIGVIFSFRAIVSTNLSPEAESMLAAYTGVSSTHPYIGLILTVNFLVCVFAFTFTFTSPGNHFLYFVITFAAIVFFAIAGAFSHFPVFASVFASVIAIALALVSFFKSEHDSSLLQSVLFIILPVFNAFLDWISWAFSRYFLERASKEDKALPIIQDIVADLILAIFFMVMLCLLIPLGAEALNLLYGQYGPDTQFDWRSLALSARDDPWGEGLMVTLMILSTLIPTVIHIVLALIALVLQSFMGNPILNLLREHEISRSNFPLFGVTGLVTAYFVGILVAIGCLYQLTVWAFSFNVSEGLYDMTMLVWS